MSGFSFLKIKEYLQNKIHLKNKISGGKKWVYLFDEGTISDDQKKRELLGGKGANLVQMTSLGFAVPPGLIITTEACMDFNKRENTLQDEIKNQILKTLSCVQMATGKKYNSNEHPLLLSVRSGAKVSMPGMMDTILNLGLNEKTLNALIKETGNEWFCRDTYRRFIQMYANVVLGLDMSLLEKALRDMKKARGIKEDIKLKVEDLQVLACKFKSIVEQQGKGKIPENPMEQLWAAIGAVFQSWNNERAVTYRNINNISHCGGTAVTIQSMVFGNMGGDSATGVCFTRNPSTGKKELFGEFLFNAQGEDVVAGIRTPFPINENSKNDTNKNLPTLEESMPGLFGQFKAICDRLEKHYKNMQDIEFTIEKGKLYLLQTRNGKRTANAALKIAVDLHREGILSKDQALLQVKAEDIDHLLHPRLDPKAEKKVIAKGLPASPGAATGTIVFSSEDAESAVKKGKRVILVRQETNPDDIGGMQIAKGILTAKGGMTSHAAVVARGMGRPCVVGCQDILIDYDKKTFTVKEKIYQEGDGLSLDGASGEVIEGIVSTIDAEVSDVFSEFMSWADEKRKLQVRCNADSPKDGKIALDFGAQGVGLCRTEHMFFGPERILAVREMIFAQTKEARDRALKKLLPCQREDFVGIFTTFNDLPVTIRLLDPPLHEFMPTSQKEKKELASILEVDEEQVKIREKSLHEFNPMLGHRGCRLGITYPEIYEMQVRAIIEAAVICQEQGVKVHPEIMIPLVSIASEFIRVKNNIIKVIESLLKNKTEVNYKIGTMIELPRAAICAAQMAQEADFFSFGTNDLTQTTFGLSRDDSSKFLPFYVEEGLLKEDPFVSLDTEGTGFLITLACKEGRKVNKNIHLGICGEHGGDPRSIQFCHQAGLDYVSCSPYRIAVARLAAAQAALMEQKRHSR